MNATDLIIAVLALAMVSLAVGAMRIRRSRDELRARADRLATALTELEREAARDRWVSETILGAIADGLLLVGPAGEVVFANRAVATHLGPVPSSLGNLLPLTLRTQITEARRQRSFRSVVAETGAPSRWVGAAIVPAADKHTLVVIRDVTEERRLEAVRRDFVENASHELKTPVATIQATAETLRGAAEDDPEAVPRFAARLEREAVRLSRIVADLLDLSRLESGGSRDEVVSMAAVARDECRRLQHAADEAAVALSLTTEGPGTVRGSSQDLSLLVRNLVDNAIRYSAEGAEVVVDVRSEVGETRLRVQDTGIGIPSRDLSRIFERFYRVDRARSRETGGTGLGLAIVKHVVENHGGRTSVESELGRGTTFEVTLPAEPPP